MTLHAPFLISRIESSEVNVQLFLSGCAGIFPWNQSLIIRNAGCNLMNSSHAHMIPSHAQTRIIFSFHYVNHFVMVEKRTSFMMIIIAEERSKYFPDHSNGGASS